METKGTIKNRYDFIFLFDVKDGNPNGDPDFDNMPRIDEETEQGLVSDVCIKRKVRNYVHLLKGLEPPHDIFIREGNILNPLIEAKKVEKMSETAEEYTQRVENYIRNSGTSISEENKKKLTKKINTIRSAISDNNLGKIESACEELESILKSIIKENKLGKTEIEKISMPNEKSVIKSGREAMCAQYYDIRTFGAVMSTGEDKEDKEESEEADKKSKKAKTKKVKGLGVVRGPVQLTFARSIDPVYSKSFSVTRCCVTTEQDAKGNKNNTIGNKNNVSYGLYRMHGFISATDAAKTGFSEEDKKLLFEALGNAFENDRAAARGEMNPRALIVFKHESPLGNARAGQLFDLVRVALKEGVEFPRSFNDYEVEIPSQEDLKKAYPNVSIENLI